MNFESGKVIFFDRRKEYGFLLAADGGRVYFRYRTGRMILDNPFVDEPELSRDYLIKRGVANKLVKRPQRGEELYFVRSVETKNPEAAFWCFAVSYQLMQARIVKRKADDETAKKAKEARPC